MTVGGATVPEAERSFDVIVVGAGFGGIYMVHQLREHGFSVRALEAGTGVGGTWFWNRYPGARCDVPSLEYSYGFSEELQSEWEWSEIMPAQRELEVYLNHVVDRFDLRRDIQLCTRVTSAVFDETTVRWDIGTEDGEHFDAQHVVLATGPLSTPTMPNIPGLDGFAGALVHTAQWPEDGLDVSGVRVGVIGNGSSGVQVATALVPDAGELFVLQRSPSFVWPVASGDMEASLQAAAKNQYPELRRRQRENFAGVAGFGGALAQPAPRGPLLEATAEERRVAIDELGLNAARAWSDVFTDPAANEIACDIYAEVVQQLVGNPEVAARLSPREQIGCRRPVLSNEWFDMFNRENVTLVDLRDDPIEQVVANGVRLASGVLELDVLVLATGFDAVTGAVTMINPRGRDGRTIADEWKDGPSAYLGLQTAGFPNLFVMVGPGSPSVLSNMPVALEQQGELVVELLEHMRVSGFRTVEPSAEAQNEWMDHVDVLGAGSVFNRCDSWYVGANVAGKARKVLIYVGGLPGYIEKCRDVMSHGYPGFTFT
jgi:cation diffusion facilitator CzcD-associated flavoprotein CzcO